MSLWAGQSTQWLQTWPKLSRQAQKWGCLSMCLSVSLLLTKTFRSMTLQSFHRVELEDASLLGAPLFPGAALDTAWDGRCEDLARAVDRLSAIGSQDALILLMSLFSAPKVLHLLCCPSAEHPSLGKFDGLLRHSIQQIPILIFLIRNGYKPASQPACQFVMEA